MKWTVVFYRTAAGCPFENFLDSLPGEIVKKITWILAASEELENAAELYFKKAGSRDIYDCLVKHGDAVFRISCFFCEREMIILLGGMCVKFHGMEEEETAKVLRYKNDFLLRKKTTWET